MLLHLHIQNFALIDEVKLGLENGFTALTGETGSGKSILLGALDLVLGERADFSSIGNNGDKAIVEAEFDLAKYDLDAFFKENDLDIFSPTLIRREINKQGRSRAFINDSPVSLAVLKSLTERLIHIHSQHNTLEIRNANFQMNVVDDIGGLSKNKEEYSKEFKKWLAQKNEVKALKEKLALILQERDYSNFLLEELEELQLKKRNYKGLEEELKRNENVDELKSTLDNIVTAIGSDDGASVTLRTLKSILDRSKGVDSRIDDMSSRIHSVLIELDDISEESNNYLDHVEIDPERLSELTLLLDAYNRLLRKHNFVSQDQLNDLELELVGKLNNTSSLEDEINIKQNGLELLEGTLRKKGETLHKLRIKASVLISKEVISLLGELKMPGSQFVIDLRLKEDLSLIGLSEVKFLFSSNKGMEPVSIEKAASGGELSRLMLVLQKLISVKKQLPTIIFDEIDTGVSGDVAQKIGVLLNRMGENSQLIAITHLPQVAGKANYHLKVSKSDIKGKTQTQVQVLSEDERIEEVARLMSGEEITDAALLNAKNLMGV